MKRKQRGTWFWLKRLGLVVVTLLILVLAAIAGIVLRLSLISHPVTFDVQAAERISYEPWRQLIPGPQVPEGLEVMSSNNNLDIV